VPALPFGRASNIGQKRLALHVVQGVSDRSTATLGNIFTPFAGKSTFMVKSRSRGAVAGGKRRAANATVSAADRAATAPAPANDNFAGEREPPLAGAQDQAAGVAGSPALAIGNAGLDEMLARASEVLAPANDNAACAPQITIEQFPGLCMGATMLVSLSLHKIGYAALTEKEGEAVTAALLKNALAWDLSTMLENPKAAAALDFAGCMVAILLPRIIAESSKPAPSAIQAAAAARDDLAAAA
jgi:hypothetical protein